MEKDAKDKWKCFKCKNKEKKGTPVCVRTIETTDSDNNISSHGEDESDLNESPNSNILKPTLLSSIRSEIQASIDKSLKMTLESTIMKEFAYLKSELATLSDLKNCLEFLSAEYDCLKSDLEASENKIKNLTKENISLNSKVSDLTNRLNLIEQHSRETNIEINGLPENKSENLNSIIEQLCSVVSVPLQGSDILSCTRVRKLDDSSPRPRAVIVKLPTTKHRDVILAAVTKFNKKNQTDKLSTNHLGYGTNKSPVYVSEHLSPHFKALHARTRKIARDKEYRYTWIRNGRIYVRKNDQSPAKQIKCFESLDHL